MLTIKLLPHQNYYIQAPNLFREIRYFLLCAGYGSGKTRSNVFAVLDLVKSLQGKKDGAGDFARIIVAGYTLSHLEATFLIYFRQILNSSKTPYVEDKKHNFFIVGTVMVMLVPLENPERLFGRDAYACVAARSLVITRRNGSMIKNIPIKKIKPGDEVFTRAGWRRVLYVIPKGIKPVIRINRTVLTMDHKVLSGGIWKEAQNIRPGEPIWSADIKAVRKTGAPAVWQESVTAIGRASPCEVYDLVVEGQHEFFADGLLVHNCVGEEIDELTEEKCVEAVRALSERCRQQIIGCRSPYLCFGSTSQGLKGLYRIYNHFQKFGVGFVLIRGLTEDNIYLPKEYIQDMRRMYSPEEFEVYAHGKFLAVSKGRIFPDFDWKRNYLNYDLDQSLLPGEEVLVGMDFNTGFNRASAYVVRNKTLYCIKYYDFPNPQDAPSVFRHDFPEQRILWIPDVTIKDSFPQFGKELRRYDIHTIYRSKSPLVEDTVFLMNKMLRLERLMVCRIAAPIAEALSSAMRDKDNKIQKGKGSSSPIHAIDGARYVASFVAANKGDFADIRKLIMEHRASLRNEPEELVTTLHGGYVSIDPHAM
jgi:hypothetical protein